MLNYETGNIDGWLASGYTSKRRFRPSGRSTLKAGGPSGSDGQPLNSDDVVFTINMNKAPSGSGFIPCKM